MNRHLALSKQHFKTSKEKHHTFCITLDALLCGKKPAILFDISATTSAKLQSFIDSNPFCAERNLKIVQLREDFVIVDVDQLSDITNTQLPDCIDITFIDCSRYRKTPVPLNRFNPPLVKQFHATWKEFKQIVETDPSPVDLSPQCSKSNICLTTIFGMFLQYPFIYYTCDDINCLSGEELYLFKVGDSTGVFTSYTCPVRLCGEDMLARLKRECLSVERVVMDRVAL